MAFINLLGEREALTGNSKEYKLKIISFMKKKDIVLLHLQMRRGIFQISDSQDPILRERQKLG